MTNDSDTDGLLGTSPPTGWMPRASTASALTGASILSDPSSASASPIVGGSSGIAPATSPSPPHTLLNYAKNPTPVAGIGKPSEGFVSVAPHANVSDLNPEFARRAAALQQAAKAAGIDTTVTSGYRSTEQQAELYAKYKSGQGGIAAPPGMSYHNHGNAVDMYASDPSKQAWLVANAPKFGLYAGANFGDPGHFQIAGANVAGDHAPSEASMGTPSVASPEPPAVADASQNPGAPFRDEMKLKLLQGMFPQHGITPVEYDPWKYVPKGLDEKVDVTKGVG